MEASPNDLDSGIPNYKWDEEKLIMYYKKRVREICAEIVKADENKKKGLINYIPGKFKPNFDFKFQNKKSNSNSIKTISYKKKKGEKYRETDSVLNILFPYVKEDYFKIEEFKTGSDLLKESSYKQNIAVIKLNQEKRIKSNFNKKFKKYDKELNTYADTPSIRCSSAYTTEDQAYRRELIKDKKKWVAQEDFKKVFGRKTENDRIKEYLMNTHVEEDIYIEPYRIDQFRAADKTKWVSKKNFIV
jgi:hypothetical protein